MALYNDMLSDLREDVFSVKPLGRVEIDRLINRRIRRVCQRHPWSDLIRQNSIVLPDLYNTGTVSVSSGSKTVTGSGTAWPITDALNGTTSSAIVDVGYTEIVPATPADMLSINPGDYILLDTGHPSVMEVIVVEEVTATSFWAKVKNQHNTASTLVRSSLAGRQILLQNGMFTVKAVVDASTLVMDMAWGGPAISGESYRIALAFVCPDPASWRLRSAWDPQQGLSLETDNLTFVDIVKRDPQMTSTGDPLAIVPAPLNDGGLARWFIWPIPTTSRLLMATFNIVWPKLVNDTDRPPPFLDSNIFVEGARADALATKKLTQGRKDDPYYDLVASQKCEEKYHLLLMEAIENDEVRTRSAIQQYGTATDIGWGSPDYDLRHAVSAPGGRW